MSRTILTARFQAPRGLSNPYVQTLLPHLLPHLALECTTETLDLPDGDFVELAWACPAPPHDDAPLFVLFHGLEGSVDSSYARILLNAAVAHGWRGVLMHFRGCGKRPNRLARAYHSGDTADAYWLIAHLARRYPRAIKVAVGVSQGGNVLTKLVAEQGGDGLDLAGAIAISPALDLAASADALNQGAALLYQRHLLKRLKHKIIAKLDSNDMPLPITLTRAQVAGIDSLWAYDDQITAPLHGFASVSDYYRRASAGRLLGNIELPMLILHAADDPVMPVGMFERLPVPSDAVRLEIARHGGHVGFVEAHRGRLRSWLARRVLRQLQDWAAVPRALTRLSPSRF